MTHQKDIKALQRQIDSVSDPIEGEELTLRRLDLEQAELERQAVEAEAELADLRQRGVTLQLAKARGDDVDQSEAESIDRWAAEAAEKTARMPVALTMIQQQREDAQGALNRLQLDNMLVEYNGLIDREEALAKAAIGQAVKYQSTVDGYGNLRREIHTTRNRITAHLTNSPALRDQTSLEREIPPAIELTPGGIELGQFRHWYRNRKGNDESRKSPI